MQIVLDNAKKCKCKYKHKQTQCDSVLLTALLKSIIGIKLNGECGSLVGAWLEGTELMPDVTQALCHDPRSADSKETH